MPTGRNECRLGRTNADWEERTPTGRNECRLGRQMPTGNKPDWEEQTPTGKNKRRLGRMNSTGKNERRLGRTTKKRPPNTNASTQTPSWKDTPKHCPEKTHPNTVLKGLTQIPNRWHGDRLPKPPTRRTNLNTQNELYAKNEVVMTFDRQNKPVEMKRRRIHGISRS